MLPIDPTCSTGVSPIRRLYELEAPPVISPVATALRCRASDSSAYTASERPNRVGWLQRSPISAISPPLPRPVESSARGMRSIFHQACISIPSGSVLGRWPYTRHQLLATRHGGSAAFTLLEVLVASAIMGIVMFVLVSTANTSLQLWRGTSEKIAVDREGRAGLALLAWDLQNIIQPTNIALRPWINDNIFGTNASFPVLKFLTLKPADYQNTNSDFGDVCYVEYRFTNRSLKRAFIGSARTFTALSASTPAFPSPADSEFQTLVPNVWTCKFWGTGTDTNITYNQSTGQQTTSGQILRTIEYRLGILDQKFMTLYTGPGGDNLARAQQTNGIRWYQAIQPVPAPAQ